MPLELLPDVPEEPEEPLVPLEPLLPEVPLLPLAPEAPLEPGVRLLLEPDDELPGLVGLVGLVRQNAGLIRRIADAAGVPEHHALHLCIDAEGIDVAAAPRPRTGDEPSSVVNSDFRRFPLDGGVCGSIDDGRERDQYPAK